MIAQRGFSAKVNRQRLRRQAQQRAVRRVSSSIAIQYDDDDINLIDDADRSIVPPLPPSHLSLHDYVADEDDNIDSSLDHRLNLSPPLFAGTTLTVATVTDKIVKFSIQSNLDKSQSQRLLKLIKSILPHPNLLPVSHKSILRQFGRTTMFSVLYLCMHCSKPTVSSQLGYKMCSNCDCIGSARTLRNNELTEIVTLDIRSSLESILTRNIKLLIGQTDHLFHPSDISRFKCYQTRTVYTEQTNMITLLLHTDGAPLVRSTKQNLWPIFASIVELPSPTRDYHKNILALALWASRKKPDVDRFLEMVLVELRTLIDRGMSIFIENVEYHFVVRLQCFIADLPAKALFLKTINFNGRNACTYCMSPGPYSLFDVHYLCDFFLV
jgi:hypothetical protein